jgi:exocyst complex component 3
MMKRGLENFDADIQEVEDLLKDDDDDMENPAHSLSIP